MSIESNREFMKTLKDRICIYKEKSFVRVVKITEVYSYDDSVSFDFEVIPTEGFEYDGRTNFSAGTSWDVQPDEVWEGYSDHSQKIGGGMAGWILVISPDLVEKVKAFAVEGDDNLPLFRYINRVH